MENIFSHAWKGRHGGAVDEIEIEKRITSSDLSSSEDDDQV